MNPEIDLGKARHMKRIADLHGGLRLAALLAALAPGATAHAQPAGRIVDCRVESAGKVEFSGKCRVIPDGTAGSFALAAPSGRGALYGSILVVSVAVVARGVAEVRGLTRDGINSRWGEAKRSSQDPTCWDGADFRVCTR
jgi:hypothetical protein